MLTPENVAIMLKILILKGIPDQLNTNILKKFFNSLKLIGPGSFRCVVGSELTGNDSKCY